METIHGFTDAEAAMGARYANLIFGFAPDKTTLRRMADSALQQIKQNPHLRLCDVSKEISREIRFEERAAYVKAVGKMLSERNVLRRHRVAA